MPQCPPRKDVPFAVDVRGFETTIRYEPCLFIRLSAKNAANLISYRGVRRISA